jgi:hypothetical protein
MLRRRSTLNSRQRRPAALVMMQECFKLQCDVLGQTHPTSRSSLHGLELWKTDKKKSSRISRGAGGIAQHLKARISE